LNKKNTKTTTEKNMNKKKVTANSESKKKILPEPVKKTASVSKAPIEPAKKSAPERKAPIAPEKKSVSASKAPFAPEKKFVPEKPKTSPVIAEKSSKESTKVTAKKSAGDTKLTAMVDVGWGNSLYIRGDAPGLSWDKGTLMTCKSSNSWQWATNTATDDFAVKFLINDDHWSSGEDFKVKAGKSQTVEPSFFTD
jgi:hypothetical protein